VKVDADLDVAFRAISLADAATMRHWRGADIATSTKADDSPVTVADVEAETSMLDALRQLRPNDGFLGEEVGEHTGTSGRRWIADGIDGTRFFIAGTPTWGTLLALEVDGLITIGVASSPAQGRRWWAVRGGGAFTGDPSSPTRLRVSTCAERQPDRVVCLPTHESLPRDRRRVVKQIANGRPADRPWSHQLAVAEGTCDVCVWFAGDVWDHAVPSLIVEEAGGRFSDHAGGNRLDTRTAVYTNGRCHDDVLRILATLPPETAVSQRPS
jgi:histidinol-phosphatase